MANPLPPKPVTKVITQKVISPLTRADLSKPRAMQQKPTPSSSPPVEEPLEEEGIEDVLDTENLENEVLADMAQDEPVVNPPSEPKKEEIFSSENKKSEQSNTIPKKEKNIEESARELEELMNGAEKELEFLSTGTKKHNKVSVENSSIKKENIPSIKEKEKKEVVKKEETISKELESSQESSVKEDFWEDDRKYKEVDLKVSIDFSKKYTSCYLNAKFSTCPPGANIFLREVPRDSIIFRNIVQVHNQISPNNVFVVSPFKFFQKQDFVSIFQKAFLGTVFDLAYSTPYYYTKEGTHHIYFSSQIIEDEKMPHFVLLDLIPKKIKIYNKQDLNKKEDFTDFEVYRIVLVSINALYL